MYQILIEPSAKTGGFFYTPVGTAARLPAKAG